jgi:hypothetical protein
MTMRSLILGSMVLLAAMGLSACGGSGAVFECVVDSGCADGMRCVAGLCLPSVDEDGGAADATRTPPRGMPDAGASVVTSADAAPATGSPDGGPAGTPDAAPASGPDAVLMSSTTAGNGPAETGSSSMTNPGGSSGGPTETGSDGNGFGAQTPPACQEQAGDSACVTCARLSCCGALDACANSADCQSYLGCINPCTTYGCVNACAAQYPAGKSAVDAIDTCKAAACGGLCYGNYSGTALCTQHSDCAPLTCAKVNGATTGTCVAACGTDADCGAGHSCRQAQNLGLAAGCFQTCSTSADCQSGFSCLRSSDGSAQCYPQGWFAPPPSNPPPRHDQCSSDNDCPSNCEGGDNYACCTTCKTSSTGNYCGQTCTYW